MNKLKNYILGTGIAIAAFFIGKSKGGKDEKIKNINGILHNVDQATRARNRLHDSNFVRRMHEKYRRK